MLKTQNMIKMQNMSKTLDKIGCMHERNSVGLMTAFTCTIRYVQKYGC